MTTLIESLAGVPVGSRLGQALKTRAEILRLSEAAHDAVLSDRHRQHLQNFRAALNIHAGDADDCNE